MSSWEFYQEPESGPGIAYPLWWLCGAARGLDLNNPVQLSLQANSFYAVPFDQMRQVSVSKVSLFVASAGQSSARCRVGIYQNASSANNKPASLALDAGEFDLSQGGLQTRPINPPVNLQANIRYWAALLSNADADQVGLFGLGLRDVIFWGIAHVGSPAVLRAPTGIVVSNQAYGALPATFPTVDSSNLSESNMPAIMLAFSSVT